ncbi:MAG: spore gernimation protein [Sulfobacillus thermosulfidooxidans]|uniref:Spore gernimation protein n=1 Tax=Sulfobacillus thermosulfidooxidans TaxID=28034 RepID=A0A2T2X255_SULTH|nr:MAG: spore gernimation protein [Sulfobacillus thermosulfidooxidans]
MMTFRKVPGSWKKVLLLLLLGISLTGCWDNRPVDSRALVFTLGLEPSSNPEEFRMLFQFPTPPAMAKYSKGSGGSSQTPPVADVVGQGKSVAQCFNAAQSQVSRDLYLGQIQLIAISTHLSAPLLTRALESLERIGTLDKTPFLFVTSQPLEKVASVDTDQEDFPTLYYTTLFSCQRCQTDALGVRLWQFAANAATPGIDPSLPQVTVDAKTKQIDVDRIALYQHLRYVGTLDANQTMTFGLLKGEAHKVSLFLPRQQATLRAIHGPSHLTVKERNGIVYASFYLKLYSTLEGIKTQTETEGQLAELSQEGSAVLAHRCLALLQKTQKMDVDPFGVGRKLDWRYPGEFTAFKHWHQEYPKVHMSVHVDLRIDKMGDIK